MPAWLPDVEDKYLSCRKDSRWNTDSNCRVCCVPYNPHPPPQKDSARAKHSAERFPYRNFGSRYLSSRFDQSPKRQIGICRPVHLLVRRHPSCLSATSSKKLSFHTARSVWQPAPALYRQAAASRFGKPLFPTSLRRHWSPPQKQDSVF